jgi:hypothetical protein
MLLVVLFFKCFFISVFKCLCEYQLGSGQEGPCSGRWCFYDNGEPRFYHLALHAILLPHAIHLPTACLLLAVITSNQVAFLPSLSTVLSLRLRTSEQA